MIIMSFGMVPKTSSHTCLDGVTLERGAAGGFSKTTIRRSEGGVDGMASRAKDPASAGATHPYRRFPNPFFPKDAEGAVKSQTT